MYLEGDAQDWSPRFIHDVDDELGRPSCVGIACGDVCAEWVPIDVQVAVAERDKLVRELTGQKQSQVWERWVATARSEAKIDVVGRREPKRG